MHSALCLRNTRVSVRWAAAGIAVLAWCLLLLRQFVSAAPSAAVYANRCDHLCPWAPAGQSENTGGTDNDAVDRYLHGLSAEQVLGLAKSLLRGVCGSSSGLLAANRSETKPANDATSVPASDDVELAAGLRSGQSDGTGPVEHSSTTEPRRRSRTRNLQAATTSAPEPMSMGTLSMAERAEVVLRQMRVSSPLLSPSASPPGRRIPVDHLPGRAMAAWTTDRIATDRYQRPVRLDLTGARRRLMQSSSSAVDVSNATLAVLQQIFNPICTAAGGCTCWNGGSLLQRPVCNAESVVCNAAGDIIVLALPQCGLTGPFPPGLSQLSALQFIDFRGNALTGPLPTDLGALSGLQYLFLSDNQLSGSIPSSLGHLSELQYLALDGNRLAGSIPLALGQLTNLHYLLLQNNLLSGPLPAELGQLRALEGLVLSNNQLSGGIPSAFGALTALQTLDLSSNALTGPIPSSLGNLRQLRKLFLQINRLNGSIPAALGNLTQLTVLQANANALSGTIPDTLGQLRQLQALELDRNVLRGTIPPTLGQLSSLIALYLFSNQLEGPIPDSLGNLTSLQELYLFDNNLIGPIPSSLGNLQRLLRLFLYDNQLDGPLPDSLGSLTNLEQLVVHHNRLTGPIPDSFGSLANLQQLYLHNNALNGCIPCSLGNLVQLNFLGLSNNALTGPVPASLGNLDQLYQLSLHSNQLNGSLPDSLANLTNLVGFTAHSNQLTGALPPLNASYLAILDLHNNSLTGTLDALVNCPQLQVVHLAQNRLHGALPSGLSALTQLQLLLLYDNQLSGGVPAWLFAMPSLQVVFLSSNPLGGALPNVSSDVTSPLQQLDLTRCELRGSIPPTFSRLTKLSYLALGRNRLSGIIPLELGRLVFQPPPESFAPAGAVAQNGTLGRLKELLLNDNELSGPIPVQLLAPTYSYFDGNCEGIGSSSLTLLDVSNNQLTGTLPANAFLATDSCDYVGYSSRQLIQLVVSGNRLEGALPADILLPPLSVLDVSNNRFTGPLPALTPGFSIVRSLTLANNSFSGEIPLEYGQVAELSSLVLTDNPGLHVRGCDDALLAGGTANASHCLPWFLTVNPQLQQFFAGGLVCNSITARNRTTLSVQLDQARYLLGAQCFCDDRTFPAPRNSTGWYQAPQCVACTSSWCQCSGSSRVPAGTNEAGPGGDGAGSGATDRFAMTNCWAVPTGNDSAVGAADWTALECPYIASPHVTACQLSPAAVCVPGDLTCQCRTGYQNRRCTQCWPGYYDSTRSCQPCQPALRVLLPLAWSLALLVYTAYLLLVPGSASGVLKVLTFYGQSLLLLSQNAGVPWPTGIRQLLHSSGELGSLTATALPCVAIGIEVPARYIVYACTPLLLLAVCGLVYAVNRWLRRWPLAYDVFVYMALSMLLTVYFSVTLKALAGVSCTLPDGYLNAYPWIRCSTEDPAFRPILALSVASLLAYTLGVPLVAGYHLFRKRGELHEPHIARRLGFLFGSYRPACYWWEYVVLARRLLLAAAITLVPFTQQPLTAAVVMAVLVLSVALQHYAKPFATRLENRLEQLSLYTLLLAFLGVYVSQTSAGTADALGWLPVLVVALVSAVATLLVLAALLVLLVRVVPSVAASATGRQWLAAHEPLSRFVDRTAALRERLLSPTDEGNDHL